jgi:hypothetical protein
MSMWSERTIACPSCGAERRARIALGAHVGRAPQVRDDVLARRFHRVACACGLEIRIEARFEYTDIERRQLLLVGRTGECAAWPELEGELRAAVHRVLELGSPLVQPFAREVKSRVVFGTDELREKLIIWDAGLDDGIVECIKVRAFASDPGLAAPGSRLLVDEVTDSDALACLWSPRAGAPASSRLELPSTWVRDAYRDRGSLEARFPELFRGGFVSVDRMRSS